PDEFQSAAQAPPANRYAHNSRPRTPSYAEKSNVRPKRNPCSGQLEPAPGLISEMRRVPAPVPSDSHSSYPNPAVGMTKTTRSSGAATSSAGAGSKRPVLPGIRSATMWVPLPVPSEVHSSDPAPEPSSATKYTRVPDATNAPNE